MSTSTELAEAMNNGLHIFVDLTFKCNGEIAAWKFHANNIGTFFAAVWRKVNGFYFLR